MIFARKLATEGTENTEGNSNRIHRMNRIKKNFKVISFKLSCLSC
jgi:hypothetical protein